MRTRTAALALILAGALVPATSPAQASGGEEARSFRAPQGPAVARRAGPADQLVSASAAFPTRATGLPLPEAAAHQRLVPGASFTVDYGYHWQSGVVTYNWSINAAVESSIPDEAPVTLAGLGLGVFAGGDCVVDTVDFDAVSRFNTAVFMYGSGDATTSPNAGRWDCAALFTTGGAAGSPTYDAFVSRLDVVTARPQLSLRAPRRDRLVRGVWTEVPVTVANAAGATVAAREVAVAGAGKGVRVRGLALDGIQAGRDAGGYLWVRLTKPRATLRLTVTERGETLATGRVALRTRPVPAPPRAGSWSGHGVDFAVRRGRVTGFRIATRTTCGGYPGTPTTTNNTYSFPTVAIPRNNEVSQGDRGNEGGSAEYSVYLRMHFVGRTKAKGTFGYSGPAGCRAFESFTVKRR